MTGGKTAGTRVELYTRMSLPEVVRRRRDAIVGRLDELDAEGVVSAVETHTWSKKVPTGGDSTEWDRYERFRDWAAETGVGLAPFFETRQCYSMTTGERADRLVLPALCLAVYRDGDLQSVYPHSANDGSRTVMDCLRAIESARRSEPTRSEEPLAEASD